jgi:hypothetical protein
MVRRSTHSVDPDKLCRDINVSRLSMRRHREIRVSMVREYVGDHYSEEGARRRVILNLLSEYVRVVGRALVPKNPRVLYSTFDKKIRPVIKGVQKWANKEIEKMELENTLRRVVIDALFGPVGIAKICLAAPIDAACLAWNFKAGQPIMQHIDLDDFAYDVHCNDLLEAGWIAHRVRVPVEVIKDDPKNYSKQRKLIQASEDRFYNMEGDERISIISRGYYSNQEEWDDFTDIWEVYLPHHRQIMVFADDQVNGPNTKGFKAEPLAVRRWIGPDQGPFLFLGYNLVPGNAMFKGPLQDLFNLHLDANMTQRKISRTIERMKELTCIGGGAGEDADRINKEPDGNAVRVDRPDMIVPRVFGGMALQQLQATGMLFGQQFNQQAGNLELLSGAGAQSPTLGQDRMLDSNANAGVQSMVDDTINFTSKALNRLGWFWWHDPFAIQEFVDERGSSQIHDAVFPANHDDPRRLIRNAPWGSFDLRIDPFSMQHKTPQQKAQELTGIIERLYIPLAAMFQAQGVTLDLNEFLSILGDYNDMPDLAQIMTVAEKPEPMAGGGGGQPAAGPANTTRTYQRNSTPTRTQQGDRQNMMNTLMGVNPGGNPNGQPMNGMPK